MDRPKIKLEPGKWHHNQRVSPDTLREGLELLKTGVEGAVKETEKELEKYQQTLVGLTKAQKASK